MKLELFFLEPAMSLLDPWESSVFCYQCVCDSWEVWCEWENLAHHARIRLSITSTSDRYTWLPPQNSTFAWATWAPRRKSVWNKRGMHCRPHCLLRPTMVTCDKSYSIISLYWRNVSFIFQSEAEMLQKEESSSPNSRKELDVSGTIWEPLRMPDSYNPADNKTCK